MSIFSITVYGSDIGLLRVKEIELNIRDKPVLSTHTTNKPVFCSFGFACYSYIFSRFCLKIFTIIPIQRNVFDKLESIQRSEEHTSELQSRENLVCRLL